MAHSLSGFIFLLLVLVPAGLWADEDELVFGLPPYANPAATYQDFSPLVERLALELKRPVRLSVAPNYTTHMARLARGELDLAFLGPSPYIKMRRNRQPVELLAKAVFADQAVNRVVIVTAEASGLTDLSQLKGRTFAFGDYHSFGSHFMPRHLLRLHGVTLAGLANYDYLGSHDNVALAVLHRDFSAGGLRHDIFLRYRHRPLRILHGPVAIPPPVLVVRPDLARRVKAELLAILTGLEQPELFRAINPAMVGLGAVGEEEFVEAAEIINFFENH